MEHMKSANITTFMSTALESSINSWSSLYIEAKYSNIYFKIQINSYIAATMQHSGIF